jgi:hypothetical protein
MEHIYNPVFQCHWVKKFQVIQEVMNNADPLVVEGSVRNPRKFLRELDRDYHEVQTVMGRALKLV